MPKKISIASVKKVGLDLGLTQIIIAGWDGSLTHIATWGKSKNDCAQAAESGNKIKKALGWPKDLNAEPQRVKALQGRIKQLEDALSYAKLRCSDAKISFGIDGKAQFTSEVLSRFGEIESACTRALEGE